MCAEGQFELLVWETPPAESHRPPALHVPSPATALALTSTPPQPSTSSANSHMECAYSPAGQQTTATDPEEEPCAGDVLNIRPVGLQDRLCLFQVSKGLAAAVMQHTGWGSTAQDTTGDMLLPSELLKHRCSIKSDQQALESGVKRISGIRLLLDVQQEQGVSQQQLQARGKALQHLLATAPHAQLHVYLKNGISAVWVYVPARQIVRLTISDVSLQGGMESVLTLQQCSKLHTLAIINSQLFPQQHASVSALSEQQRAAFHVPSLQRIEVQSGHALDALRSWGLLLGKQVTHLSMALILPAQSVKDSVRTLKLCAGWSYSALSTLSALTHFHTMTYISDQLLDALVALPSLTHVKAAGIDLDRCHLRKQLQWQELWLQGAAPVGVYISGMQHIQLRQVQHVRLSSVRCFTTQNARELAAQITLHPSVSCLGEVIAPSHIQFDMLGQHYTADLLLACAAAIKADRCHLVLDLLMAGLCADLLPAFSNLPPHVTCLSFMCDLSEQEWPHTDPQQEEHFVQQVARAVPTSVRTLNIHMPHLVSKECTWAAALLTELAAVGKKRIRVGVAVHHKSSPWPSEAIIQLAKAHSKKVLAKVYLPSKDLVAQLRHVDGKFTYKQLTCNEYDNLCS